MLLTEQAVETGMYRSRAQLGAGVPKRLSTDRWDSPEKAQYRAPGIQGFQEACIMNNRQLVAQLVECWNTGKLEPIDEVLSPKFVRHEPEINGAATGRDDYKQTIKRYRGMLGNFHTEATDIIEQDNKIVFRFKTTGKSDTGPVTFEGVNILRVEGNKVVEDWVYFDVTGLKDRLKRERAA